MLNQSLATLRTQLVLITNHHLRTIKHTYGKVIH